MRGLFGGYKIIQSPRKRSLFGITGSLDGLEQIEDLRWLDLAEMDGVSLEPMAALEHLGFLSLNDCRGMDYTPLLRIPALGE